MKIFRFSSDPQILKELPPSKDGGMAFLNEHLSKAAALSTPKRRFTGTSAKRIQSALETMEYKDANPKLAAKAKDIAITLVRRYGVQAKGSFHAIA